MSSLWRYISRKLNIFAISDIYRPWCILITPVWQVLEPKQSSSNSSTCFGSPAVGYCNSNAGSGQGTSGRNGYVSMNLLWIHHTSPSSLFSQLQYMLKRSFQLGWSGWNVRRTTELEPESELRRFLCKRERMRMRSKISSKYLIAHYIMLQSNQYKWIVSQSSWR